MTTTSIRTQISQAVAQLHEHLGKEITDLTESVQGMSTLTGTNAAKAIQLASDCSVLREQLLQFLKSEFPAQLPNPLPAPTPVTVSESTAPKRLKLALSRTEAAEALGVSPVTIDRLVSRRLLHPSLATRRPLFSPAELERFMRETSKAISPD